MANNNVLIGVSLLENAETYLEKNTRVQIKKTNLEMLRRVLGQAVNKLDIPNNVEFEIINFNIISTINLLDEILKDVDFDLTDEQTKTMIIQSFDKIMSDIYVAAAKHYFVENEFDYNFGLDALLERIITNAIRGGFYFGKA